MDTSPILGLRILRLLMDRKNEPREDNYLLVDQVLDYFNGMGFDRSITYKHLDIMLKRGLLYSYDPTVVNIHESKRIEISPSGIEHYLWTLNDNDYLFVMIEVTPISNRDTIDSLKDKYYEWSKRNEVKLEFLQFIEDEDRTYCHVPKHEAYKGQENVLQRLEHRRKQIREWMRTGRRMK